MVDNTASQTDIKTISLASGQATATASYELYASHEYTFLLWADDGSYNAEDLTNITLIGTPTGTQAEIAYAAKVDWDKSATVNAELKHAVSKVTLKTTSTFYAGNTLTLTVPVTYTGYNVLDSKPTGNAATYSYNYNPTSNTEASKGSPTELFSFYVLAADAVQDITINWDNETIPVPANLAGGKHITLTGNINTVEPTLATTITVSTVGWSDQELSFGGTDQLTDDTPASTSLQGTGIEADPYRITSVADLKCYFNNYNTYAASDTYARLYTDIEINTASWPMVTLSGTFDGGNHTISGTLTNIGPAGTLFPYFAFFGMLQGGTIRNLILDADVISSGSAPTVFNCGGIVGYSRDGTIENCENHGRIDASGATSNGNSYTGGIAGCAMGGSISGCTNTGTVLEGKAGSDYDNYTGGIVGSQYKCELSDNHFDQGTPNKETGN